MSELTGTATLVYGATGVQGGAVVRALLNAGQPALGLVRDEGEARQVRDAGAEAVIGDFEDLESLKRASEQAGRVFLVLPLGLGSETTRRYGRNAIDAVRSAGVELVVFNTSTRIPEEPTGMDAYEDKREIEGYLAESGVPFVSLRPTFYMGNFLGPWIKPGIVREGVVAYPIPAGLRASWINWEDAAAYAAAALRQPHLAGRTFDIGGPEALDGDAVAGRFASALARPVSYYPVLVDDFEKGLSAALGPETGRSVAGLYRWMEGREDTDVFIAQTETTKKHLPVAPTSLSSWIREQDWSLEA
jgi:uncharacterized protein YbjT (DUF2867 family)